MKTKVEKLPKSTIKLTVVVENKKVKDAYEEILTEAVKTTEMEGFRKGTAPKSMIEEKLGPSKLYGDVVNKVLQSEYIQALKENSIQPVSNPKVEIKEFDLEKDLEFVATVAIRPDIKIGDYKKKLKISFEKRYDDLKKELEKKAKEEKKEKAEEPHLHMGANEVIDILIKEAKLEVSDVLVEEETERMLNQLMQQAQTIGLTMDQYLKAQDKTEESLQEEYEKIAENNIKAEFILAKLITDEKIEVTDKEIDDMINAVGDEVSKQKLTEDPMQKYYIKSILQKNKLLSKLIEEAEGEHHHEHEHK